WKERFGVEMWAGERSPSFGSSHRGCSRLTPDVLLQRLRPDFGAVDVARGVDGHPFSGAGAGAVLDRIGDERNHLAVADSADADAALPVRAIARHASRFRIGDVDRVVFVDV